MQCCQPQKLFFTALDASFSYPYSLILRMFRVTHTDTSHNISLYIEKKNVFVKVHFEINIFEILLPKYVFVILIIPNRGPSGINKSGGTNVR